MNYWLLTIPICSAFIGWITIKILFKFLFHPHNPKKIFGFKFQGILPKNQNQIARKIGAYVNKEFLSTINIEEKISSPQTLEKILPTIDNHVEDFLRNGLPKQMPMISMFIGDKTISKMKSALMTEIETLFPTVMKQYAGNLLSDLDLENLITNKIASVSIESMENNFSRAFSKDIRKSALIGGLIGFIIGLIEMLVIWMAS